MPTPDFPSNSHSTTPAGEPRKIEKVVTSEVTSRPKSVGKRLKEALIGGDSKSVVQYVIVEVLIPQAKEMLAEAATQGFERLIFGDGRSGSRRSAHRSSGTTYTNYTRYSDRGNRPLGSSIRQERSATASVRARNLDDIIFQTRAEAQEVLEQMYETVNEYSLMSVADLYTMLDWEDRKSHTDHKWGWEDLQGSSIRLLRGGYLLTLPKPIPLD